jgi:hypothetical protein
LVVYRAKNVTFLPHFARPKAFELRSARLFRQFHGEVRAEGRAGKSGKLERPWESYGRLLLLLQLLDGHAVCPGDLRHGRHVGRSFAGLQVVKGPVGDVGKLRRLLLRKTPLLPKNPQLHRTEQLSSCAKYSTDSSPEGKTRRASPQRRSGSRVQRTDTPR